MFYIVGLVAAVASFAIGCLWYTALFGAVWQREMGFSDERVGRIFVPGRIALALASELVAALCMTGMLLHLPYDLAVNAVMVAVVLVGAGVKLAVYDGKSLLLIAVNQGYQLLTVAVLTSGVLLFGSQMT
ncbi:DUF1761 domain-containing protein [Nocardioides sp. WV_118_6]